MAFVGGEMATKVAAAGHRLRLLQVSLADEVPAERTRHLAQTLAELVDAVAVDEREAFLDELAARFPAWSGGAATASPLPPPPADLTAAQLLAQLLPKMHELDPAQREQMQAALDAVSPKREAPAGENAIRERLSRELHIDQEALDAERVARAVQILLAMLELLDRTVTTCMAEVIRKAPAREQVPTNVKLGMRKVLAGYLCQAPRAEFEDQYRALAVRLGALTQAVHRGPSNFATNCAKTFAPEVIEQAAKLEAGVWQSREAKAWAKYVELAPGLKAGVMEQGLMKEILDVYEEVLRLQKPNR